MGFLAPNLGERIINHGLWFPASQDRWLSWSLGVVFAALSAQGADPAALIDGRTVTNRPVSSRSPGPITNDEARQALKDMHTPVAAQGTWRSIHVFDDSQTTRTNTVYEWHGPDDRRLVRSEVTRWVNGSSSKSQPQPLLRVQNEEGSWTLHDRVAILSPAPMRAAQNAASTTNKTGSSELDLESDPQIVADLVITGERVKEGERMRLRITKKMGEKAQKRIEDILNENIKEMKKEIPLLLRPLLTASRIREALSKMFPVRTEMVIDEETNTLVVQRGYAKDGRLILEERAWTPCPDLSAESYAIPKNLKLLRPKTADEADRLESEAMKEDEKSRRKR